MGLERPVLGKAEILVRFEPLRIVESPTFGRAWAWLYQLALKKETTLQSTNLNAGRGDPCAGHSNARGSSTSFLNLRMSDSCESFGLADPMGSKGGTKAYTCMDQKAGMGDPCAEQRGGNTVPSISIELRTFTYTGNHLKVGHRL